MIITLKEICALQPAYSPQNTPPMQQRGRLIRRELPAELRTMEQDLRQALGAFGGELGIDASDGIGRKTEAPWVRIFAKSMAPTPREGFYVVIHFAADGSAVFITLGCGSTVWANGELRPVSDAELARRTGWARRIITEKEGTLEPFGDQIVLGARASLPRTFEKATAVARKIPVSDLDETLVRELVLVAVTRLSVIYEAQRTGRDLTAPDLVEMVVAQAAGMANAGQGFGLNALEKRAVERRAMELAESWLVARGFRVRDCSSNSPFDLMAMKAGESLKIEVKGTTGDSADAVLMTHREVALHREEKGQTGLITVSQIRLEREPKLRAIGGNVSAELAWNIDDWDATPIAFKLVRRTPA